MTTAARHLLSTVVIATALLSAPARAGEVAAAAPHSPSPRPRSDEETTRVIVTMVTPMTPEAHPSTAAVVAQRRAIDASLDTLDADLVGTGSQVLDALHSVPAALIELDRAGLDALRADPAVESIVPEHDLHLLLDSSTTVIESGRLNRAGVRGTQAATGRPYEIAVIDTGVARGHHALAGKVVSETCFSLGDACPNGRDLQFGPGSAAPCTFAPDSCGHGTHVAGIAAGRSFRGGHEGVAPRARIVAIRVGQRAQGGGWSMSSFDLDRALQRVLTLRRAGRPIVAVNLSVGFAAFTSAGACRAAQPSSEQLAEQLRAARVAVIAAAGNEGFANAVSFPACLPSVYAVSATDDADRPTSFSNVARMTDWFAPGVDVVAPWPGGPNNKRSLSGTSMSTPHVAGAFALLRECVGNTTPAAVAADLSATGPRVTDSGITRRRIDVLRAASRNVPNDDFANARQIPPKGQVDLASWNVCAGRELDEPGRRGVQNTVWFRWRPADSGRAVISTENRAGHRTTFDTELAVFTGRRLGTLVLVAHDDNGGTGRRSRAVFRVEAGTRYSIRVDGIRASHGRFNLHVRLR